MQVIYYECNCIRIKPVVYVLINVWYEMSNFRARNSLMSPSQGKVRYELNLSTLVLYKLVDYDKNLVLTNSIDGLLVLKLRYYKNGLNTKPITSSGFLIVIFNISRYIENYKRILNFPNDTTS